MIVVLISPPAVPRVLSTNSTISVRTSSAACFPMSTSSQPRTAVTASAAGTMLRIVQYVTLGGDVLDGMALVGVAEGDTPGPSRPVAPEPSGQA